MIVSAVELAGSWAARIVEDQTLKALEPFRVKLAQCFEEGALPYAGGTAQNHETPTRLRHQSPHLCVLSVPVNPLEVGLRFEKPFVHFYSTFARALAKICRARRHRALQSRHSRRRNICIIVNALHYVVPHIKPVGLNRYAVGRGAAVASA